MFRGLVQVGLLGLGLFTSACGGGFEREAAPEPDGSTSESTGGGASAEGSGDAAGGDTDGGDGPSAMDDAGSGGANADADPPQEDGGAVPPLMPSDKRASLLQTSGGGVAQSSRYRLHLVVGALPAAPGTPFAEKGALRVRLGLPSAR